MKWMHLIVSIVCLVGFFALRGEDSNNLAVWASINFLYYQLHDKGSL